MTHRADDTLMQQAAALFCEGMDEPAIAAFLSIKEADVHGLLEAASQKGYFVYRPILASELYPDVVDSVRQAALTAALTESLTETLACMLAQITVTPSPPSMFSRYEADPKSGSQAQSDYLGAEKASVQITSARAAHALSNALFDGEDHFVGLNWGAVVWETVHRIRPLPSQIREARIAAVSLFGDLDFFSPAGTASGSINVNCNHLVMQLVQRLGGRGEAVPLNVPGFIPARFAKKPETFEAIRAFMMSHSSYRRIFGEEPEPDPKAARAFEGIRNRPTDAVIAQVDSLITGLGTADSYTVLRNYHTSLLDADEIQALLSFCRDGKIVGDIGGHLIESQAGQDDPEVQQFLHKVNARLLAAQPSDFIDVAGRRRKTGKGAGVMAVTVGARKAEIVHTLLSWDPSPINALVTDTHCALALLHRVDPKGFHRFILSPEGRSLIRDPESWSPATRRLIPVE